MKTGLLWYDADSSRALATKVMQAARRYRQKFGQPANICYVHPSALDGNGHVKSVGNIALRTRSTVLINHLWIGREEAPCQALQ